MRRMTHSMAIKVYAILTSEVETNRHRTIRAISKDIVSRLEMPENSDITNSVREIMREHDLPFLSREVSAKASKGDGMSTTVRNNLETLARAILNLYEKLGEVPTTPKLLELARRTTNV